MPPNPDSNPETLRAIAKANKDLGGLRAKRDKAAREQAAALAAVAKLERGRTSMVALATTRREINAIDAKLVKAKAKAETVGVRLVDIEREHTVVRDRLDDIVIGLSDPAASLDGGLPVALLPVRLETRFVGNELRVRIYPDTLHIDQLERLLTADEEAYGHTYWQDRWALSDATAIAALWDRFAAGRPPNRLAWIVERTTPTNVADIGQGQPAFPRLDLRPEGPSQAPRAELLPARWLVLGYRDGAEVLRTWGSFVADPLPAGVAPTSTGPAATAASGPRPDVQAGLAIDDAARWIVDYDAAVAAGMAVTIGAGDVQGGDLRAGFDQLLVVGVDHRRAPTAAAADLDAALTSHHFGTGLGFVEPGAPTNAGPDVVVEGRPLAADPSVDPATPAAAASGPLLARALGLADDGVLARLDGAELVPNRHAADLHTALWEPTLGYFLRQILDPLVSETQVGLLREHFRRQVRPRGPLPLLRVGRQPFGVLPVVALGRLRGDATDELVGKVLRAARPLWAYPAADAKRLGDSGDPGADLVELLERASRSVVFRLREVLGPGIVANTEGADYHALFQQLTAQITLALLGVTERPAIVDFTLSDEQEVLPVPLVTGLALSENTGLDPDYVASVLAQLSRSGGFLKLAKDPSGASTLLEALLVHASTLEVTRATTGLVLDKLDIGLPLHTAMRDQEIHLDEVEVQVAAPRSGAAPAKRGQPVVEAEGTAAAKLSIGPLALANQSVTSVSGRATLANYVAGQSIKALRKVPQTRQLSEFRTALGNLVGVPTAELHRTTADALDALSHRYDAWATSLATKRLDTVRARAATGIHLGGFGWVEDLRPSDRPTSMGYVHAPSIPHATTAAILRSGHLARSDGDAEPLAIDLSSRRVRDALKLVDGLRSGQTLSALLGYRYERALRDRGAVYAAYILPTRQRFPCAEATDSGTGDEPLEAIAAQSVVDGVRLAELDTAGRTSLLTAIGVTSGHRAGVTAELDALADAVDALADLLLSESVFQAVVGNTERSAAALDALDRQLPIPEVAVARTPRTGIGVSHRLLVTLDADRPPATWDGTDDVRAAAEPRVNAWVGRLLGDPDAFRFGADVVDGEGVVVESVEVALAELGLSPLSSVLAASHGAGEVTELEERLALAFAERVSSDTAAGLQALDGPPPGAPAGSFGLRDFTSAARRIADLLSSARAATTRDFAPDTERHDDAVDVDELTARAAAARTAVEAVTAVDPDDPSLTDASVVAALRAAANLGVRGALPRSDDPAALLEQLRPVVTSAQRRLDALDAMQAAFDEQQGGSPTPQALARFAAQQIRHVLGEDFPVVPVAELPESVRITLGASASDAGLLPGAPLAPTEWALHHSRVRPSVERLWSVLTGAELRGAGIRPTQLTVAQFPHVAGERWLGLPLDGTGVDPTATTSLVLHRAGDVADPATFPAAVAGLAIDQWSERIPRTSETTGVSFHFDGPGARAPQSVLLAVPPDLNAARWSMDALVDTVREVIELTRMRTLDLDDLPAVGRFLPALYFAFDLERAVPSLDLRHVVQEAIGLWQGYDASRGLTMLEVDP